MLFFDIVNVRCSVLRNLERIASKYMTQIMQRVPVRRVQGSHSGVYFSRAAHVSFVCETDATHAPEILQKAVLLSR